MPTSPPHSDRTSVHNGPPGDPLAGWEGRLFAAGSVAVAGLLVAELGYGVVGDLIAVMGAVAVLWQVVRDVPTLVRQVRGLPPRSPKP